MTKRKSRACSCNKSLRNNTVMQKDKGLKNIKLINEFIYLLQGEYINTT